MPESDLRQILLEWKDWPVDHEPVVIQQFHGGKNHAVYELQIGEQKHVLKIFSSPQTQAIQAQSWAALHSLAPEIIYAPESAQYCLMHKCDASTAVDIVALADALSNLHRQENPPATLLTDTFDILNYCRAYLQDADEQAGDLHEKLLPTFEPILTDQSAHRLCHNDLVAENCFFHLRSCHFIDWEYAQLNNPWFDLAAVIHYFELTPLQVSQFFTAYDGKLSARSYWAVLSSALCSVLWLDILWHLANDKTWQSQQKKLLQLRSYAGQLEVYF